MIGPYAFTVRKYFCAICTPCAIGTGRIGAAQGGGVVVSCSVMVVSCSVMVVSCSVMFCHPTDLVSRCGART